MDLNAKVVQSRRAQHPKCTLCEGRPAFDGEDALSRHLGEKHYAQDEPAEREKKIADYLQSRKNTQDKRTRPPGPSPRSSTKVTVGDGEDGLSRSAADSGRADALPPPNKKLKSPSGSVDAERSPTPDEGYSRRPPYGKQKRLWQSGEPGLSWQSPKAASPKSRKQRPQTASHQSGSLAQPTPTPDEPDLATVLIRQPETRPISQEQLVAEVKGIYAGLVMVESKCIEVDNAQNAQTSDPSAKLNNEQWQALIALHRTLLHEHHDFFLASQHPSASQALRRLASKYAMPARMWRHGIHSFLELLRHRLPQSLEHMLTFIYLAYSMMALLYETVPAFEETWIECLGDLGRYRMAIEDDDIRDREVWTAVSRHWYSMASDKAPTTGRLYHHLAILARPNAVQQNFYYAKSLCVEVPFRSAKESIMTLFDPILNGTQTRLSLIDVAFVKLQGIIFTKNHQDKFGPTLEEYLNLLDTHIARSTRRWLEPAYHIAITINCGLLDYGTPDTGLLQVINKSKGDEANDSAMVDHPAGDSSQDGNAILLADGTDRIILKRFRDPNVLPYIHCRLVFMMFMADYADAMAQLSTFSWALLVVHLNSLLSPTSDYERIAAAELPVQKGSIRPLPEDWALRGLLFADKLFPAEYFSEKIDDDEKLFETPSMADERKVRILWLARRIASLQKFIIWDEETHTFSPTAQFAGSESYGVDTAPITEDIVLPDAEP